MENNRSPFVYSRDKLIREPAGGPGLRHLTDEEVKILRYVNRAVAVTIAILADQTGMTSGRVRILVNKLCAAKYIQKYVSRDDRRLIAYVLGQKGQELLNSRKREAILSTLEIKKVLAVNQFLNFYGGCWREMENVTIRPLVTEAELPQGYYTDRGFRPEAVVQNEDHTLIVFAVRSEPGALENLVDDLDAAERTLFSPVKLNFDTENSRVMLVCEDSDHQKDVAEALGHYAFPVYLTNDLDIFNGVRNMELVDKKRIGQSAAERIARIIEEAF